MKHMNYTKKVIIGMLILALVLLYSCGGCGGDDGIVNNPIEVADNVKVGMTRASVDEVVDVKYFQDNRAFRVFMVADLVVDGENFTFKYTKNGDATHYGLLFFSVESKTLKPAVVILKCLLSDEFSDGDPVVAVGAISFDYGQMIVEEETGNPFRR